MSGRNRPDHSCFPAAVLTTLADVSVSRSNIMFIGNLQA